MGTVFTLQAGAGQWRPDKHVEIIPGLATQ